MHVNATRTKWKQIYSIPFLFQRIKNLKHVSLNKYTIKKLSTVAFVKVTCLSKPQEANLNIDDIIKHSDNLYNLKQYLQAYELLKHYKNYKNVVIIKHLCKILLKLSSESYYSKEIHLEMINEGIAIIENALDYNYNDYELHKWLGIFLNAQAKYKKFVEKIENAVKIKKHLLLASNLNPNDKAIFYMLGYFCYQFSSLTWFQKLYTKLFFVVLPDCSMEESYNFFVKADQLLPLSVANTFMLGKTSMKMGQLFRAAYYFTLAAKMIPNTENDKKYVTEARRLSKLLHDYDLSKDALKFLDDQL